MAASDLDEKFVTLQGGMTVPAPAYVLLLELERRGFGVRRDHETLVVQPASQLTADDCRRIRHWKHHLLMLLEFCERPGLDAHLFTDRSAT